jgi:5-methylcytosine-specific restriction endonuclease McrA
MNDFAKTVNLDPFALANAIVGRFSESTAHVPRYLPGRKLQRRIYPFEERAFIERIVWLKTRGRCFYCKKPVSTTYDEVEMVKDHFIPLFHEGPDDHSNLVPSCKACDKRKGSRIPDTCPPDVIARLEER